jgi:hypothetical protein
MKENLSFDIENLSGDYGKLRLSKELSFESDEIQKY